MKTILTIILFTLLPVLAWAADETAIRNYTNKICVSPTVDTGAYAAGDLMGAKLTFANAGRYSGNNSTPSGSATGIVQQVLMTDLGAEGINVELVLWDQNPSATTFTDQAALDIADADLVKVAGSVLISSHSSFADNGFSQVSNLGLVYEIPETAGTASYPLYGALVARGAVTYDSATALMVCINVLVD